MKKNMGFNLIELLISLLVVAIGLFAIAKMQILGIHGVEQSKSSTASTIMVGNVIERLSKQRDAIRIYLDNHEIGYKHTGANLNSSFAPSCSETDTDISSGSVGNAKNAIDCEISYWVSSLNNAMKLGVDDGCYVVAIEDSSPYAYKAKETSAATYYKIPKIKVSILWNQISGSNALAELGLCSSINQQTGLHNAPAIGSNIGFSTMEYLAP